MRQLPHGIIFQSWCGGDKRDRTADLLNAIQALSQLSYAPITIKIILERRVLVNTCAAAYKNFVGR